MKKTVKSIDTIFGAYVTTDFVEGLLHIADEAQKRAILNRNDQVQINLYSQETADSVEGVIEWTQIKGMAKEWLRNN